MVLKDKHLGLGYQSFHNSKTYRGYFLFEAFLFFTCMV